MLYLQCFFFFLSKVSLCSLGCLVLIIPASTSQSAGLKACTTTPGFQSFLFIYLFLVFTTQAGLKVAKEIKDLFPPPK